MKTGLSKLRLVEKNRACQIGALSVSRRAATASKDGGAVNPSTFPSSKSALRRSSPTTHSYRSFISMVGQAVPPALTALREAERTGEEKEYKSKAEARAR